MYWSFPTYVLLLNTLGSSTVQTVKWLPLVLFTGLRKWWKMVTSTCKDENYGIMRLRWTFFVSFDFVKNSYRSYFEQHNHPRLTTRVVPNHFLYFAFIKYLWWESMKSHNHASFLFHLLLFLLSWHLNSVFT